jgi:hypothetical protein
VSPAGGGATDKTAELRANRIRQIEYDSHAQEVYTVAGENMATRGYGYARIVAEYEDSESDNQILRLKAIPNPNQVLPDPDAESTSGADWQYLFFVHTITDLREFKRDYPDARIKDFEPDVHGAGPKWFGKDGRVQIAEYWYVTETPSPTGKGKPSARSASTSPTASSSWRSPGKPKKTSGRARRFRSRRLRQDHLRDRRQRQHAEDAAVVYPARARRRESLQLDGVDEARSARAAGEGVAVRLRRATRSGRK